MQTILNKIKYQRKGASPSFTLYAKNA